MKEVTLQCVMVLQQGAAGVEIERATSLVDSSRTWPLASSW